MTERYDVIYAHNHTYIEPHFCREWDPEHGGCYGTNPEHGVTFEEAKAELIAWYESRIESIKKAKDYGDYEECVL